VRLRVTGKPPVGLPFKSVAERYCSDTGAVARLAAEIPSVPPAAMTPVASRESYPA
jgi:hypothetical protein